MVVLVVEEVADQSGIGHSGGGGGYSGGGGNNYNQRAPAAVVPSIRNKPR